MQYRKCLGFLLSRGLAKEKGSWLEGLGLEGQASALHFDSAQPPCLLTRESTGVNKILQATDAVLQAAATHLSGTVPPCSLLGRER